MSFIASCCSFCDHTLLSVCSTTWLDFRKKWWNTNDAHGFGGYLNFTASVIPLFLHFSILNLSLPLFFFSRSCSSTGSHFSMLGIGDIVMPGLLLCFVLRYDNYKKQATGEVPGPGNMSGRMQRVSYFHCTLIGYFVGKQRNQWTDGCKRTKCLDVWIFFNF